MTKRGLSISIIIFAVLGVGLVAAVINQPPKTIPDAVASGGVMRSDQQHTQSSPRKGILKYFNETTGEVDRQAVADMAASVPSMLYAEALSRAEGKIQVAVDEGSITSTQADELRKVLKEELQ